MRCLRSFVFSSLLAVAVLGGGRDAVVVVSADPAEAGVQTPGHRMDYKYSRFSSKSDNKPPSMMADDKVGRRVSDIEKSAGDSRVYRGLVLKNGLTALLISDPETDKSAASLSVAVG